jgi:hypothetical protein
LRRSSRSFDAIPAPPVGPIPTNPSAVNSGPLNVADAGRDVSAQTASPRSLADTPDRPLSASKGPGGHQSTPVRFELVVNAKTAKAAADAMIGKSREAMKAQGLHDTHTAARKAGVKNGSVMKFPNNTKETTPMTQTGTGVLREAVRIRIKKGHAGLLARDFSIGTATLEAFATGGAKLPDAIMDAAAKYFFGSNCSFDAERNLLKRAKPVSTSIGIAPPPCVRTEPILGAAGIGP